MEPEVTINRTNNIHPCFEIEYFSYILRSTSSKICILIYIFLGSLSVVTICGNLLVMISIIYFKQLHTPANYLILSLAVADLLVGGIVYPFTMVFSFSSCYYCDHLFCKVRNVFDITLSVSSIQNLCCISLDRYYAVCHPLTYRTKINGRVVVIMIFVSWCTSGVIAIGISMAIGSHDTCKEKCLTNVLMVNIGFLFSFYLPLIIMLCIYLKIFLVARRQARSIQSTKPEAALSKMERKATKTLAIIMGVFLVCWTPSFLYMTFNTFGYDSMPIPVIETIIWLSLLNSMLNPFIYAFFYSWFRSAFKMIISGKIFRGNFVNLTLH